MDVKSIVIELQGPYDIDRLQRLGFRMDDMARWIFDGKLHRYMIQSTASRQLRITISPRPPDWRTDHASGTPREITFPQIRDWIGKCVDVLEGKTI